VDVQGVGGWVSGCGCVCVCVGGGGGGGALWAFKVNLE
jgi:hypothetical protein